MAPDEVTAQMRSWESAANDRTANPMLRQVPGDESEQNDAEFVPVNSPQRCDGLCAASAIPVLPLAVPHLANPARTAWRSSGLMPRRETPFLTVGYMMANESAEWPSPMLWPTSWSATVWKSN